MTGTIGWSLPQIDGTYNIREIWTDDSFPAPIMIDYSSSVDATVAVRQPAPYVPPPVVPNILAISHAVAVNALLQASTDVPDTLKAAITPLVSAVAETCNVPVDQIPSLGAAATNLVAAGILSAPEIQAVPELAANIQTMLDTIQQVNNGVLNV